ncbi:MAG TPA: hypothetical protein VGN37_18720 [Actinocatenispora sp.]
MSTEPAIPALFRGLVDDAALFPPGNAPMPVAVAEHRHHTATPYAGFVGPLLVPATRWDELVAELGEVDEPLDIGLIGPADALTATVPRAVAEARVELRQVECPLGEPAEAADTARRLDALDNRGEPLDVYLEIPRRAGWLDAVAVLAELPTRHPVGAKLRTGGLAADAFPTTAELTDFVTACVAGGLRFKLTAGLHHAVRHTDPATGLAYHGYLNALAAVCRAWTERPDRAGIGEAVAASSAEPLVAAVRPLAGDDDAAGEVRGRFASYGSCSVAEPLTDLVGLGLLHRSYLSQLPAPRET